MDSSKAGTAHVGGLADDGHYTPTVKRHSLRKIELHDQYVSLFSRAMKKKWPQRAYLGLYSGAGRALVEETGEIVDTTALSAIKVRDPLTKYIFVDKDRHCIEALEARISALDEDYDVTFIQKNVPDAVPDIIAAMPEFSKGEGLLSFCFIDPFSAELDFEIFRTLGKFKMDFLVLLMLGRDVRTNFRRYFEDKNDARIARLIDDDNWRADWIAGEYRPSNLIRFMLDKFNQAMTKLGYRPQRPDDAHPIRIGGLRTARITAENRLTTYRAARSALSALESHLLPWSRNSGETASIRGNRVPFTTTLTRAFPGRGHAAFSGPWRRATNITDPRYEYAPRPSTNGS